MRYSNEADDLAFNLMGVLNNNLGSTGGYYETKFGILHLWWSTGSWVFEYVKLQELPKEFQ